MVFELVYCSIAKPGITSEDIDTILKTAREFNAANELTGCLLFHNNQFAQILEGKESTVKELYSSIAKDERHENVQRLVQGEKEERKFSSWSMAFHQMNDSTMNEFSEKEFIGDLVAFSDLTDKPTDAIEVFWDIAKIILTE